MYLIAHRGNLNGKSDWENQPNYIEEAIQEGFDVEIDVWYVDGILYLGHDEPQYKIKPSFLRNNKLWCHAKNSEALMYMSKTSTHYFWHEEDDFTITSKGIIWQYPSDEYLDSSIFLMPENFDDLDLEKLKNVKGICSDFISNYSNL